jgi:hypothetical protein
MNDFDFPEADQLLKRTPNGANPPTFKTTGAESGRTGDLRK